MSIVVSVDVGIRNMAFAVCRIVEGGLVLERAGTHAFSAAGSVNSLVPHVVEWCETEFPIWDVVLVENQLGTTMKALQCALLAHFHTRAKGDPTRVVTGVPPRAKLRGCEPGATYARRKAFCVEQVRARVEGDLQLPGKPDDVCDAVMQAVTWCEARGVLRPGARISMA